MKKQKDISSLTIMLQQQDLNPGGESLLLTMETKKMLLDLVFINQLAQSHS